MTLNNNIVDKKLIGKNIKRLDDYNGNETPIRWQCLIQNCYYIWTATPHCILPSKNRKGTGCPECAGTKKLTNEIIDNRLVGRNILRLDNYINSDTAIRWKCLASDCKYIWPATPHCVCRKNHPTGCPQCSGLLSLTNEIIDKRLIDRNIKRLDNYTGAIDDMHFLCTIINCNYIWTSNTNRVIPNDVKKGTGCPKCAGNIPITNEEVDGILQNKNLKRLSNVNGASNRIKLKCLCTDCNYIWSPILGSILYMNSGCPQCSGTLKLTNDIIDQKLQNRNIQRIGEYINNKTPLLFKCLIKLCLTEWVTQSNSVINNETGCPNCFLRKNEKIVGEILKQHNILVEQQKWLVNIVSSENKKIKVDFYLPHINTIIEYNGRQHYEPVCFGGISQERAEELFINYQRPRDKYLQQFCNKYNITLLSIDGRKYTNSKLKTYLISTIIPNLKKAG